MTDEIKFGDVHEPATMLDPRSAFLVISNDDIHADRRDVVVAFVDQGDIEDNDVLAEPIAGCGTAHLFELMTVHKTSLGRRIGQLPRSQWDSVGGKLRHLVGP